MRDGDVKAALDFLYGKVKINPTFYQMYNVDEDNCLTNLFWADSTNFVPKINWKIVF